MNIIKNEDGDVLYRAQYNVFRLSETEHENNVAHKSAKSMFRDAIRRAERRFGTFVHVSWAVVGGQPVGWVGMLRITSTENVEFTFMNKGREDFDVYRRSTDVLNMPCWEGMALAELNRKVKGDSSVVYSRNLIVFKYMGKKDAAKRLVLATVLG